MALNLSPIFSCCVNQEALLDHLEEAFAGPGPQELESYEYLNSYYSLVN